MLAALGRGKKKPEDLEKEKEKEKEKNKDKELYESDSDSGVESSEEEEEEDEEDHEEDEDEGDYVQDGPGQPASEANLTNINAGGQGQAAALSIAATDAAAEAVRKGLSQGGHGVHGAGGNVVPGTLSPTRPRQSTMSRIAGGREKKKKIPRHMKTKHRKIDKHHPEFELTYDMMLGIRTTVSMVEAKPHSLIKKSDFEQMLHLRFPGNGSATTPAHVARDFKFKDYCPEVFRQIRARFDIDPAEYLLCICGKFEFLEFISNSKSGQFFFYSHDRRYMIKTVSQSECKFLRKILPDYYDHIMKNPNTLITRFFGMHRVKPHKKKETHFLIMGSVFYTQRSMDIVFDLKGSRQGRSATEDEKKSGGCVYKDNDFVEMKESIALGPKMAEELNNQLARDVEVSFLFLYYLYIHSHYHPTIIIFITYCYSSCLYVESFLG